jgi:hypothetical protein
MKISLEREMRHESRSTMQRHLSLTLTDISCVFHQYPSCIHQRTKYQYPGQRHDDSPTGHTIASLTIPHFSSDSDNFLIITKTFDLHPGHSSDDARSIEHRTRQRNKAPVPILNETCRGVCALSTTTSYFYRCMCCEEVIYCAETKVN